MTVQLLNNNLFAVLRLQCLNLMFKVSVFFTDTLIQLWDAVATGWLLCQW